MSTQLALRFDEAPVTRPAQERYHTIAPILSGKCSPAEQADFNCLDTTKLRSRDMPRWKVIAVFRMVTGFNGAPGWVVTPMYRPE